MRYLGIARKQDGHVIMPDTFTDVADGQTFEAVEVGGDILLSVGPLDRDRLDKINRLARQSIEEHRSTLEGLAR